MKNKLYKNVKEIQYDNNNNDKLEFYYSQVRDLKKISDSEINELVLSYQKDCNKKSLDILIKQNLLLVISIAKTYKNYDIEELVQSGVIGLIEGINRFKINKNTKLMSYCAWYIKKEISDYMYNIAETVRVPYQRCFRGEKVVIENISDELANNLVYNDVINNIDIDYELNNIFNIVLSNTERYIICSKNGIFETSKKSDTILSKQIKTRRCNIKKIYENGIKKISEYINNDENLKRGFQDILKI